MTAQEKMSKAVSQIALKSPFWAAFLLRLDVRERSLEFFESLGVPEQMATMCTNGRAIWWYGKFVDNLSVEEIKGTLCHEIIHCIYRHCTRREDRHPMVWNISCDQIVNTALKESGFELPPDTIEPEARFADMLTEEIYAILMKEMRQREQNQGSGDKKGSGKGKGKGDGPKQQSWGQVLDADGSAADRELQEQEWKGALEEAVRAHGDVPASLRRMISEEKPSKVDWRSLLRRFFENTMHKDYIWSPPNRRFAAQGIYLPSVLKENMGPVVFAIDTSGSITQEMLDQMAGEVKAICAACMPEKVYVVYCDAAVNNVREFGYGEPLEFEMCGGGGTDFRPVFDYVEREGIRPKCLIYLTDLCGTFPDRAADYDTMWVSVSPPEMVAPFGETIPMSMDELK